jgi:hypothetical protein
MYDRCAFRSNGALDPRASAAGWREKPYLAATREGMKRVTVPVSPDERKRLKGLAVDASRSIEDLMREALADLFAKHG